MMNIATPSTIRAVHAPSLAEHVYAHLRGLIIAGHIPAGARLIELEIATRLGVSQGSTREALARLERDGLVERTTRHGTFVSTIDADDMREIFALRALVERFAVRRVGGRTHARLTGELEAVLNAMRDAGHRRDMVALVEHDHLFHYHIVRWADHATLLRVWQPLSAQIQRFVLATHPPTADAVGEIVASHQHLLALLRGDAVHAARSFEEHVLQAWHTWEAEHPDPTPEGCAED
jgi:DNA-binding GntR family transcriptional regulator